MDTGAALMRAIIDEPDDDVHRLVFADWLEDEGCGMWATLIRAQCALGLCLAPCERDDYCAMVRVSRLLPVVRVQMLSELGLFQEDLLRGEFIGLESRRFDGWVKRGFLEHLTVHGGKGVRRLIHEASHLFEKMPVKTLILEQSGPLPYDAPAGYGPDDPIGVSTLESLFSLPSFGRLRHLDLRSHFLRPVHLRLLRRMSGAFERTNVWVHGRRIGTTRNADQLKQHLGERLIVEPEHPGNDALEDDIPF